ncbi:MAG: hypothetical protein AB1342_06280 [Pseudomonadota bacterium]
MHKLIATTVALLSIATPAALAQNTGSGSAMKSSTSPAATRAVGNAPVGHRQPTAADVGNQQNPADLSPEEKALDRKIKSICRGC